MPTYTSFNILEKKLMEKVAKTWREMKTEELSKEKERVMKFRESKRGVNAA